MMKSFWNPGWSPDEELDPKEGLRSLAPLLANEGLEGSRQRSEGRGPHFLLNSSSISFHGGEDDEVEVDSDVRGVEEECGVRVSFPLLLPKRTPETPSQKIR